MAAVFDLALMVRRLADEVAPRDPDAAIAAFDALVGYYGRTALAEAMAAALPECAAMAAGVDARS